MLETHYKTSYSIIFYLPLNKKDDKVNFITNITNSFNATLNEMKTTTTSNTTNVNEKGKEKEKVAK